MIIEVITYSIDYILQALTKDVVQEMSELMSLFKRESQQVMATRNEITSQIRKVSEIKSILEDKLTKFQNIGNRLFY